MNTFLKSIRWFRFRLRTVLLLVALLAIPCDWIGSQWKVVRERAALIDRVESAGGMVFTDIDVPMYCVSIVPAPNSTSTWHYAPGAVNEPTYAREIVIEPGAQLIRISWLRRWLGDQNVTRIKIPSGFSDDDEKRILDEFPGTEVVKFWP